MKRPISKTEFSTLAKIVKANFEKCISQALPDLEKINSDREQIADITATNDVEIHGKKAIVIFLPVPQ